MDFSSILTPLFSFGSWLISMLARPFVTLFSSGLLAWFGLSTDWGSWILYKLLSILLTLAREFVDFIISIGIIDTISFNEIPEDFLLFVAYLRIPEAVSILMAAMSFKFLRLMGFRR